MEQEETKVELCQCERSVTRQRSQDLQDNGNTCPSCKKMTHLYESIPAHSAHNNNGDNENEDQTTDPSTQPQNLGSMVQDEEPSNTPVDPLYDEAESAQGENGGYENVNTLNNEVENTGNHSIETSYAGSSSDTEAPNEVTPSTGTPEATIPPSPGTSIRDPTVDEFEDPEDNEIDHSQRSNGVSKDPSPNDGDTSPKNEPPDPLTPEKFLDLLQNNGIFGSVKDRNSPPEKPSIRLKPPHV